MYNHYLSAAIAHMRPDLGKQVLFLMSADSIFHQEHKAT